MRQTWNKAVHSLDTGILALSRLTFGKAAFAIVLIAFVHHLVYFPFRIRSASQMKRNAEKLKELAPAIKEINEKYKVEPGQRLMAVEVSRKGKEIQQLQKEAGIKFSAGCLTALLPALSETVIKQAIAGIARDERFQDSGILWFKDLTKPERFYVLTAISLLITFLKQRLNVATFRRPGEVKMAWVRRIETITKWSPLLLFIISLVTRQQALSGAAIYNIASSGFSLAEDYYISKQITNSEEPATT